MVPTPKIASSLAATFCRMANARSSGGFFIFRSWRFIFFFSRWEITHTLGQPGGQTFVLSAVSYWVDPVDHRRAAAPRALGGAYIGIDLGPVKGLPADVPCPRRA